MAHSPAPWRVEGSVLGLNGIVPGKIISFGLNDHGDGPAGYVMRAMEISDADAALVCAAPELLEALKELRCVGNNMAARFAARARADAAIAKAETL